MPPSDFLSDKDLVLQFESLGDSCELGLVQRRVGVEPLGLFRFAGTPVRHLTRALEARFEGMSAPDAIRVQPENGEYMVKLLKYDFIYHAHVLVGEAEPEALHAQQAKIVPFLVRKLMEDLEKPEKIFVFRQNEPVLANDLLDLRRALAAYGNATLLWVQPERPGFPEGTVVRMDDTLLAGYVSRLAPRENAPDLDLESWLRMLRNAYALRPAPDRTPAERVEILFGNDGNASGYLMDGWAAPEPEFCWAIGECSRIRLPNPGWTGDLILLLEVHPFVAPPAVSQQTLGVAVNGELVRIFDLLEPGRVECPVPARLLRGPAIDIQFEHPDAISPRALNGQQDDRMLAIAFRRLILQHANVAALSSSGENRAAGGYLDLAAVAPLDITAHAVVS